MGTFPVSWQTGTGLVKIALDSRLSRHRMRAPMHPNYRNSFARTAIALPQDPILSNQAGDLARALRGERDFGNLML